MDDVDYSWIPPSGGNILILTFEGWSDAGASASTAVSTLQSELETRHFATIDPGPFYDFQQTRPSITVEDGIISDLSWPTTEFSYASRGDGGVVIGTSHEPNLAWPAFVNTIIAMSERLGVERIYTLGALLADVPHTRPIQIMGTATSPELRDEIGFRGANYSGPTGIVGVLHHTCGDRGIEAVSLWASVPHYVAATPNPKGTVALLEIITPIIGVDIDLDELRNESVEFEEQIDHAMASNPEVSAYVRLLEGRADDNATSPLVEGPIPTGEELAEELSEFLRLELGDD